jgi:hypothetical protein
MSTKLLRQLENANLSELYNPERFSRRGAESSKIEEDVVVHRPDVKGRWTYQKLAECQSLRKMTSIVSGQLRNLLVEIHESSYQPVRLQMLCLIDDSLNGSLKTR